MSRGPLFQKDYKPQFSGHETFPLRYGWLKKAYDAVRSTENNTSGNKDLFLNDSAIAHFGVGKNMVLSIRHWATTTGIIGEKISDGHQITTTELGRLIFDDGGVDPYTEHPSTLWLIHWLLCGKPQKTTWYWVLNHYPNRTFDRDQIVEGLSKLSQECGWPRSSRATIKRDVECFVRMYVSRHSTDRIGYEDALESPLIELSLIKAIGRRDGFHLMKGKKSSLGDHVFLYSLVDFWERFTTVNTLSFETIAHEPGSPGRVFLLDENDLAHRLMGLEEITHGKFRWSETAGLKQVIRDGSLSRETALSWLVRDYDVSGRKEIA